MAYKKPILVELVAHLRFTPGTLTDAKFFDIVPVLKQCGLTVVETGNIHSTAIRIGDPNQGPLGIDSSTNVFVRCWSEKRDRLAQLFPDMIAVNVRVSEEQPYLGWSNFTSFVGSVVEAAKPVIQGWPVESISLVSIDRLLLSTTKFLLGDYLQCGGPLLPGWYSNASEACDLALGRGTVPIDGFNKQIKIAVRPGQDKTVIDIISNFEVQSDSDKTYLQILEQLHEESYASFENLITDTTRKLMGGKS